MFVFYNKLTVQLNFDIIRASMGEYADMLLEQMDWDVWDEDHPPINVKPPTCKFCGKKNLKWRQISNKWILFETKDRVHNCEKYNLSIDILKEVMAENIKIKKENERRKFISSLPRSKKLMEKLPYYSNEELLIALKYFTKIDMGEPDVGIYFKHDEEITLLEREILTRITK